MRCAAVGVLALVLAPQAAASAFRLELRAPPAAVYGAPLTLTGAVTPALADATVTILRDGVPVGTATTDADGRFSFRTRAEAPATWAAAAGELASEPVALSVRPRLTSRVVGSGVIGRPLRMEAAIEPRQAGALRVEIRRNGRLTHAQTYAGAVRVGLATRAAATFRIAVTVEPAAGWSGTARTFRAAAVYPTLGPGSRGPSVRALQERLRDLRYALPRVDGSFGRETSEAVLAFQKVHGLPWTGRVDTRLWRLLAGARVPRARHPGTHLEISKGQQLLYVVRNGKVELVVHVSTGATGNTPIGRWSVYRKVPGWDWILWYPMYFLRGFAIHGYPEVPAYPASHGCVRVPMWLAPRLYATSPWGGTIYVYW